MEFIWFAIIKMCFKKTLLWCFHIMMSEQPLKRTWNESQNVWRHLNAASRPVPLWLLWKVTECQLFLFNNKNKNQEVVNINDTKTSREEFSTWRWRSDVITVLICIWFFFLPSLIKVNKSLSASVKTEHVNHRQIWR